MEIHIEPSGQPFFRLSTQEDLVLYLIEKEIRGMKLVEGLEKIGFDASFLYPDLGIAILPLMGISAKDDDSIWEDYHLLVEEAIDHVNLFDEKVIAQVALDFYSKLNARKSGV